MRTLVAFHAHPDDESISMGGTLARAAAAGNRVVVVTATDGSHGEVPDGFLLNGQTLAAIRRHELHTATDILGIARTEMLDYGDSGMMGTADNTDPGCFWQADVEQAARRLAKVLVEESADALTVYDSHGGYGHPDHIQVHRVGHRAAQLAATPVVLETTINRDRVTHMMQMVDDGDEPAMAAFADDPGLKKIGTPDLDITTAVDVSEWVDVKRRAMVAHASQVTPDSWFLQLPPPIFAAAFGTEWFIRTVPIFSGSIPADREDWLWT
ncbi:MAG: PIG-L family deacetylase [Actinomycetota bacterium]|nr:PIG-L family deacetylase [Actinomycetota bacterium]